MGPWSVGLHRGAWPPFQPGLSGAEWESSWAGCTRRLPTAHAQDASACIGPMRCWASSARRDRPD
ncbi:hypothetical protein FOA52_004365 [Chlamydomonas sp. UWO 241]|nr:hypothetical protein FOA52_004365 [Chlamydomonas sp. UWO 241]